MSTIIIITIISLSSIGILAAIILYYAAQKFKVYEDPRIDLVDEALPGANCGGCGFPGCRGFADALVKADNISDFYCPVGGNETMSAVAKILGQEATEKKPMLAVLLCSGSFEHRPLINSYDGAPNCTIVSNLYSGETGCQYGCLGLGECVEVCNFDALYMDIKTGLPVVVSDNCTACGACVEVCPKDLFELRPKGKKERRIFVSCMNKDKGGIAKKSCAVACIGCGKCEKVCKFDAIIIENFLAYIDPEKCKLCRKCVTECPTGAIHELNFPPRKIKTEDKEKQAVEKTTEQKNIN
ncbi:MAG: Fe-S cluster domain-containing protein [Bacteroidales bacterium]|nr:Fe-S cluster domain-containing protein [Bacteroidales bacterium]